MSIKKLIIRIPILNIICRKFYKFLFGYSTSGDFPGSQSYWEERYESGGNSGAGSYNKLAQFKAEIINSFIKAHNIKSIVDFGCGDGNQVSLLHNGCSYIGLDVSKSAIEICKEKFAKDNSKSFFLYDPACFIDNHSIFKGELALSLDVIFHLIEDEIFNYYMCHLFDAAQKYVIIYSSNYEGKQIYHEKHRRFTDWIEQNRKEWQLLTKIENLYKYDPHDPQNTSQSDFYIFRNEMLSNTM